MTRKIKVHIDTEGYDSKPTAREIGRIKNRLHTIRC